MSAESELNAQIRGLKSSRDTYQSRLNKLNSINANMDGCFDDNVVNVNTWRSNTELAFSSGISGAIPVAVIAENMQGPVEIDVWNDTYLSSVKNNINSEISRCQTKINNINSDINSIQARIDALKDDEE